MKLFLLSMLFLGGYMCTPGSAQIVTRDYDNVDGRPVAYVSDRQNNLYILSTGSGTGYIDKVSPSGVVSSKWATLGYIVNDFTIDTQGNLYVLNVTISGASILKVTPDGSVTLFADLGKVAAPHKVILGPTGDLFVIEYSTNQDSRIIKIAPDGTVDLNFAQVSKFCTGIVSDKAGNLYTVHESGNEVCKVKPDGTAIKTWAVVSGAPYNITIDDAGNLYTANIGNSTISKITPDGVVTQNWGGGIAGSRPRCIVMDRLGNIYTANSGDSTISKITPDGRINTHYVQLTDLAGLLYTIGIDNSGNLFAAGSSGTEVIKIAPVVIQPNNGTVYVDSAAPVGGNGSSWATALTTLQDALTAADTLNLRGNDSVHQIWVAHGTYRLQPGYSFSMLPKVKIYGSFAGTETSPEERIFSVTDTSVLLGNQASVIRNDRNGLDTSALLDGFKITGGKALEGTSNSKYGGGIYNRGVSPSFSHLVITGNSAADIGGGMLNDNGAAPLIQDVVFSFNTAGVRGGAGLANFSGSNARLLNVLFYKNTAIQGDGGALYNSGSVTTLTNTTITDNLTTGIGGAVYSTGNGAQVEAYNSIFWNNQAASGTGNEFGNSGSLAITLSHCIYRSGSSDIIGALSMLTGNQQQAPDFIDPEAGNYQLSAGSPAINAGSNEFVPQPLTMDLAGGNRIESGVIDMGAYEYQASTLPVDILGFKGSISNQTATIRWQSGVENNLSRYELQQSENGVDFNKVASMATKGSGSHYVYMAPQYAKKAYYRLKLVDLDGSFKNSQVIRVVNNNFTDNLEDTKAVKLLLYPNPTNVYIQLQANQPGKIQIFNLHGLEVFSQQLPAGWNQINVSRLSSGLYFVKINGQKGQFVKQ
ncbi:hypothetical protein GCM10027566_04150 [Arachidicoccus ginsenosidivorans]